MKILKRLKQVTQDIGDLGPRLAFARDRWQHFHDIAARAHEKSVSAGEKADSVRAKNPKRARRFDQVANRKHRRSQHAQLKAQEWVGRVKALTQQKQELKHTKDQLEADYREWKKEHGVRLNGNKVSGGTAQERIGTCARASAAACSSGKRPNFYSQSGTYDVDHCITGPPRSHRDDCSSWFASVYKSCGLPDPNGLSYSGGYTGTLGTHGKSISRTEARKTPGAAVLFGSSPFHHVELALGDGSEATIGHGSAPVDRGTFSLLPGPVSFRKYPT